MCVGKNKSACGYYAVLAVAFIQTRKVISEYVCRIHNGANFGFDVEVGAHAYLYHSGI
jgi:hypothetical protein